MDYKKIILNPNFLLAAAIVAGVIYVSYDVFGGSAPIVANGDTVQVYYMGKLSNGTVFGSNFGQQPLTFTVGANQVIPGFDQAVIGMKLNSTKSVTIPPDQAYGAVKPSLIVQVPLAEFGNQTVKAGMVVTRTENGQQIQGLVTAVNGSNATLNFNSPLAGQTLNFEIKVVSIQKGRGSASAP
ncbi:MAG: peptidylprolyl isomerase [Candidatus Micrarchaeota archaeon]|nr:peptidylprolyl isomerase [Candidatus Micrarchaeota archaeon]